MMLRPGDILMARVGDLGAGAITYNGETSLVIHLKTGKLCTVKGQVTSDDGSLVTDATISLFMRGLGNDEGIASTRTDKHGYYKIDPTYQNGTYYVQVFSPTHDQLKSPDFFIHPAQAVHTMLKCGTSDNVVRLPEKAMPK